MNEKLLLGTRSQITHTLLCPGETGPLYYKLEVCPTLWASYYEATNLRLRPHKRDPCTLTMMDFSLHSRLR
jgi:hypothetical protein